MSARKASNPHHDPQLLSGLDEPERDQVTRLLKRLGGGATTPESVGTVLPQAIVFRSRLDSQLPQSFVETTEKAIEYSVERDANVLSESLFLVIGPAIRKALAKFVREFVASLNGAFDNTISPRSIGWRVQAMRSGRSFAEIALEQTLVYRVEQAFLVHRSTGLLLRDASIKDSVVTDPDLVSAMLQAVQDFMRDSLKLRKEETVESITVGRFTILMEAGPSAVIALVIQGNPSATVRLKAQEALETMHLQLHGELERFRGGDTGQFAPAEPILKTCLQGELKPQEKRFPVFAAMVAAIVLGGIGLLIGWGIHGRVLQSRLLERLAAEPGIVVVDSTRRLGHLNVTALHDPRAVDPELIAAAVGFQTGQVSFDLKPYASGDSFSSSERAGQTPAPSPAAPLSVTGADQEEMALLAGEIESANIVYQANSALRAPGQEKDLDDVATLMNQLSAMAQARGIAMTITVTGHSAGSMADADSYRISHARAVDAVGALQDRGVAGFTIVEDAVGVRAPDRPESSQADRQANRRVSFSVETRALPHR